MLFICFLHHCLQSFIVKLEWQYGGQIWTNLCIIKMTASIYLLTKDLCNISLNSCLMAFLLTFIKRQLLEVRWVHFLPLEEHLDTESGYCFWIIHKNFASCYLCTVFIYIVHYKEKHFILKYLKLVTNMFFHHFN